MDIFNERFDTALVMKDLLSFVFRIAFIGEDNFYTGIEESLFAKTNKKSIVFIFKGLENLIIRLEKNRGAFFFGIADNFKIAFGNSPLEFLTVDMFPVFYDRSADAVKTAGNFIA